MKAAQSHSRTTIFGGLVAAVVEGLSAPRRASSQALAWAAPHAAAGRAASPARSGFLGSLGERLWRRQLESMDLQIARSDDLFANLDRWLWKQRQRETEAWLAQAVDVHDLEARIRHLERNRDGRIF